MCLLYNSFSGALCLNEADKCAIKYTNPYVLFEQLSASVNACSTHDEALYSLEMIQVLMTLIDEAATSTSAASTAASECQSAHRPASSGGRPQLNGVVYNRRQFESDLHRTLSRFTSVLPSSKSKSDQLIFSTSFQTMTKVLAASAAADSSDSCVEQWLRDMIFQPSSSLLLMIKQYLITYESGETRINAHLMPLCDFLKVYFERLCHQQQQQQQQHCQHSARHRHRHAAEDRLELKSIKT